MSDRKCYRTQRKRYPATPPTYKHTFKATRAASRLASFMDERMRVTSSSFVTPRAVAGSMNERFRGIHLSIAQETTFKAAVLLLPRSRRSSASKTALLHPTRYSLQGGVQDPRTLVERKEDHLCYFMTNGKKRAETIAELPLPERVVLRATVKLTARASRDA
ncbi:hypothetical protein J6590_092204 [Homalodisca vitripennis]|nr:hypothetical protein J6590_092204 [Homalodisca vitripennis]